MWKLTILLNILALHFGKAFNQPPNHGPLCHVKKTQTLLPKPFTYCYPILTYDKYTQVKFSNWFKKKSIQIFVDIFGFSMKNTWVQTSLTYGTVVFETASRILWNGFKFYHFLTNIFTHQVGPLIQHKCTILRPF